MNLKFHAMERLLFCFSAHKLLKIYFLMLEIFYRFDEIVRDKR